MNKSIASVALRVVSSTARPGLTLRSRADYSVGSWRPALSQGNFAPGDEVVLVRQADFDAVLASTLKPKAPRRSTQKRQAKRGSKGFSKRIKGSKSSSRKLAAVR